MATLADLEVQNARLTLMVERMWPWFVAGGGASASVSEIIDDRVAALLVAGANVTLTYNDPANTLTVAASGGGGGGGNLDDVLAVAALL